MNRRSFLAALGITPLGVTVRAVGEAAVKSGFAEIATSQAKTVRATLDARRMKI